ncbi:MAG TPA: hypothetical protein ENO09_05605 [bacterium]|nr:hypothetical protein [bacterium]
MQLLLIIVLDCVSVRINEFIFGFRDVTKAIFMKKLSLAGVLLAVPLGASPVMAAESAPSTAEPTTAEGTSERKTPRRALIRPSRFFSA